MAEIKIDENASKASDQDPRDDISGVMSKARGVEKFRWSICDPTTKT